MITPVLKGAPIPLTKVSSNQPATLITPGMIPKLTTPRINTERMPVLINPRTVGVYFLR